MHLLFTFKIIGYFHTTVQNGKWNVQWTIKTFPPTGWNGTFPGETQFHIEEEEKTLEH
jgi:hypothetical protein